MRLFLLIIAMVYAGYILFSAFNRRRQRQAKIQAEFEESGHDETSHDLPEESPFALTDDPLFEKARKTTPPPSKPMATKNVEAPKQVFTPQEFIILTIRSKSGWPMPGHMLQAILTAQRFIFGKQKLYHRHVADDVTKPILFSAASMTEPGFFNIENMSSQDFKGLVIYMGIPCAVDALYVFEQMLITAKALAQMLKAELYDEKRQPLTPQAIEQFRSKIISLTTNSAKQVEEVESW